MWIYEVVKTLVYRYNLHEKRQWNKLYTLLKYIYRPIHILVQLLIS